MISEKTVLRICLPILFLLFFAQTRAQEKYTISGKITDASTGEDLVGATIYEQGTTTGTITNNYGFYSLTLPSGTREIQITYVGYRSISSKIDLGENVSRSFKLIPAETDLAEVVVTSVKKDRNVSSTDMGVERLDVKELETIPVLLGEKDVLKTIQLLPGISAASEGGSGFTVRGGSIDQNLILLDEAPVYSSSHLMGFFSVFNSDALKNMAVYKGGIPSQYGGRASSVLDITMKDGNNQNFSASGGIGLISSRLTLEGPIIKDRMSFIVSGRRSYADLIGKAAGFFDNGMTLYFYDLNAKLNYTINDNNRVYLSGYFGKDDFGFEDVGMSWGNSTGTIRWNHLFSSKLFSNTTAIYSNYDYGFNVDDDIEMSSGIEDFGLKQDFTWYSNPKNTLRFGFSSTYHTFNPGKLLFDNVESDEIILEKKQAIESALYLSNNQKLTDRLSAEYGARLSMFNQLGAGWSNQYDENNVKIDSTFYESGELMETYLSFEPRISLNYLLGSSSSVKASFNRMAQYLHLLSNSTSGQPTDTWMPSTQNIKPTIASQYAVGYFRNFNDNTYEFSVEGYYKDMQNVLDYEDGTDVLLNENIEANILSGTGRSYGAEFYLKKKAGRLNGWFSYTLARTENRIDGINDSDWYPSKYDKTHDFSIVANYQINQRWSVSTSWVYYTGNAVTFPSGKYEYDGQILPYYTERNGYRMPDYHRLDLNFHLKGKKTKKYESSWDFSFYNLYNQKNAYTINFEESETVPGTTEAVKLSLFGIVPAVTWNFKF
ncbi:carboxypeptidase-like regulatory domain-containing protein [Mangrovibacterium sp.]|uniref:TonB-dependent receptor n=1 Tax=Mangrovibacterium sp. TaxID=1961364 RepID=UPI003564DD96